MFEQWLNNEISEKWIFLLSMANGVIGLPPSELLSFKAAQAYPSSQMIILTLLLLLGSLISGVVMFLFGRTGRAFCSLECAKPIIRFVSRFSLVGNSSLINSSPINDNLYFRLVFFGRLTPGIRTQVPTLAGFSGKSFRIFFTAHIASTTIWYVFWVGLCNIIFLLTSNSEYQVVYAVGLLIVCMLLLYPLLRLLPLLLNIFQRIRYKKC